MIPCQKSVKLNTSIYYSKKKFEKIEVSCERCNLIVYHWQNWMDELRCLKLVDLTKAQETILKIEGFNTVVTMKEVYEGDIVYCPYCHGVMMVTEFTKKI